MNSTLLVRPPPTREAVRRPLPRRVRRRTPRAVGWAALALSALIHLLVLLSIRFESQPDPAAAGFREPLVALRPITGMQVEQIVPVPDDPDAPAPEPAPIRPVLPNLPARVTVPPGPPVADMTPDAAAGVDRRSYGERIGPRMVDPELWTRPSPLAVPFDRDAALRERVAGQLELYNDSVALAQARAARALDWTRTDAEGRRWGISPEGIHLGGFTLPPIDFSPPPGKREEADARVRDWEEIRRQGDIQEGRQSIEDRARAIRERVERERREKKEGGGS